MSSDHKLLWLAFDDVNTHFYRSQKPFRFKTIWLKDDRCEGVVHSAWDMCLEGDAMGKVLKKVIDYQTQLKLWDKNTFGNIHIELARKRKQLLKAEGDSMARRGHTRVKMLELKFSLDFSRALALWFSFSTALGSRISLSFSENDIFPL